MLMLKGGGIDHPLQLFKGEVKPLPPPREGAGPLHLIFLIPKNFSKKILKTFAEGLTARPLVASMILASKNERKQKMTASASASTASAPLALSGWEVEVTSPRTGETKTFKKYFSRRQGVVIIGESTDGSWSTLWKESTSGQILWAAGTRLEAWLRALVAAPSLPEGVRVVGEVHCRFCRQGLTHPASAYAGYGPVCAKKYGLPWGATSSEEVIPL